MSLREKILAAARVPTGSTVLAGETVSIRGLTVGEEEMLADGFERAVFPVCAACIVDDEGKPLFQVEELRAMRGGTLKQPFLDILNLTYPDAKAVEKNC